MKEYLVPTGDGEAQFIERRSRFIGHIFLTETEEEALARLKQMREQYWDATHNVYAYIIRDGATRFSDDGEPGGTAGMPVLQVLQREELYNVTCVVTRYFGGILLGTGGLVRAYQGTAKLGLETVPTREREVLVRYVVSMDPAFDGSFQNLARQLGVVIVSSDYRFDASYELLVPEASARKLESELARITMGEALVDRQEEEAV